jgi:hypothetical protein
MWNLIEIMVSDSNGGRNRSHNMRIYNSILLLSTVMWTYISPSVALSQTNNPPTPAIAVRISVPKRTVTAGELIHVEVRVSNRGDVATLVPNTVLTVRGGRATALLEFELTDAKGRVSPGASVILDDLQPIIPSDENAAAKLLSSWTLLYPGTSLLFDIPIGRSMYTFLGKPGKYTLSATYASNDISYWHNRLGLSDDVLNSLPFKSWSGKVTANEITLTVVSPNKKKK